MKLLESIEGEVKRVTWLNRKQLHKDTLVVIETSILSGLIFYVMDTAIQSLFGRILK